MSIRWLIAATSLAALILGAFVDVMVATHLTAAWPIAAAIGLAGVLSLPAVKRRVAPWLTMLGEPTPRARAWIAWAVWATAALLISVWALLHHPALVPKWHDEHVYLLQARMLAEGRLWMPTHPLADFFESFYVIVKPVYAGMYFPGTALAYVPGTWLGLPAWVTAVLITSGAIAMAYRVVAEVVGGAAGLLTALTLLCVEAMGNISTMVMSHTLMLLLGLLMVWAHLRWLADRRGIWLLVTGALAGWAVIVRPLDALCYIAPVGISLLVALRRGADVEAEKPRRLCVMAALLLLPALPFLLLQMTFNVAVTGSWHRTPYQWNVQRDAPGAGLGFAPFDPSGKPVSALPQKQDYYRGHVVPGVRASREPGTMWQSFSDRFALLCETNSPPLWMFAALLRPGVLGLDTRRRWLLAAPAILFLPAYAAWPWFIFHYPLTVAASVVLVALLAVHAAAQLFRPLGFWRIAIWLVPAAMCIATIPKSYFRGTDEARLFSATVLANRDLPHLAQTPALVFFSYRRGAVLHDEPVYNVTTAWPDDAPIVRLHDLGQRNAEALRYYAERQPHRRVYLYDRLTRKLLDLGSVRELAERPAPQPLQGS